MMKRLWMVCAMLACLVQMQAQDVSKIQFEIVRAIVTKIDDNKVIELYGSNNVDVIIETKHILARLLKSHWLFVSQ